MQAATFPGRHFDKRQSMLCYISVIKSFRLYIYGICGTLCSLWLVLSRVPGGVKGGKVMRGEVFKELCAVYSSSFPPRVVHAHDIQKV